MIFVYMNLSVYLCNIIHTPFRGCPLEVMKDRISQLMKMTGKNQKEFAEELCIAQATLSGIFKGTTKPSTNIVNAIHERFPEISIPWLMFGEGSMYVEEHVTETPLSSAAPGVPGAEQVSGASDYPDLFSAPVPAAPQQTILRESVKYIDKPQRKITEIRVFYDDGTYETFQP